MIEHAAPFANTIAGGVLLPSMAGLLIAICVGLAGGARRLFKQMNDQSASILQLQHELKPNGGASLRDAIDVTREQVQRNGDVMESLTRRLDDHMTDGRMQLQRLDAELRDLRKS